MSDDDLFELRELLWQMREQALAAWRAIDPKKTAKAHISRDQQLFDRVEQLIGPSAWDALPDRVHIEWGTQAICHWTLQPMELWPASQTTVSITKLITKKDPTDRRNSEFVAYPTPNWSGVTCADCQRRLPTLLRELGTVMEDIHVGIMEGFRTDPETIKAATYYEEHVAPKLSPERRRENQELADKLQKEKP